MRRLRRTFVAMLRDESGTEVLEWGLVAGLIVVGAIAAIVLVGPKAANLWNTINAAVP